MSEHKAAWTPWLPNPGDGECPVPGWAKSWEWEDKQGSNFRLSWVDGLAVRYRYSIPRDLAWLARSVELWPHEDAEHISLDDNGRVDLHEHRKTFPNIRTWHRRQWQQAREDLGLTTRGSGKPSWDDAPEWAEWLAQDDLGKWCFYSHKPKPTPVGIWGVKHPVAGAKLPGYQAAGTGPIDGDWRETLEPRPNPQPEVTEEEEEAWRAKEAFMQDKLYMEPGMAKKIAQAMYDQKPLGASDTTDYVNHPPHYQSDNGVECIDAIRAALGREGFIAHCRGTAMKYIYRAGQKGDALECLSKAGWYLDRAAEELEQ